MGIYFIREEGELGEGRGARGCEQPLFSATIS